MAERLQEYTLIALEEASRNGQKWVIGPFLKESSLGYSEAIELGYVSLQKPEPTDCLHFHAYTEEYYVVLEGRMKIKVGSRIVEVGPREVLLVCPGVEHIILDVEPTTSILLIKAPANSGDKIIVGEKEHG